MSEDIDRAVIWWFGTGRVGVSSRTLAMRATHRFAKHEGHPHDPDDFDRCLRLLADVPQLRERLHLVAKASPYWAALVARWDEVEALHLDEVGLGWTKARSAPKTYALMRAIYAPIEDGARGEG